MGGDAGWAGLVLHALLGSRSPVSFQEGAPFRTSSCSKLLEMLYGAVKWMFRGVCSLLWRFRHP